MSGDAIAVDDAGFKFTTDWFSPNIENFERHLAVYKGRPVRFLEIGSFEGRSTVWLLRNILTHHGAQIVCIDQAFRPVFFRNIRKALPPQLWWQRGARVKALGGPSFDRLRELPVNAFDFVYVDGSHADTAVLQDAVLAFALLKEGGIIAFDDYLWNNPEHNQFGTPKIAIDAFMSVYAHRLETLTVNYQAWFRKVRDRRSFPGPARTGAAPAADMPQEPANPLGSNGS